MIGGAISVFSNDVPCRAMHGRPPNPESYLDHRERSDYSAVRLFVWSSNVSHHLDASFVVNPCPTTVAGQDDSRTRSEINDLRGSPQANHYILVNFSETQRHSVQAS